MVQHLVSSDLSKRLINTSLISAVEQPINRVLLAQQTKTVPGNAFQVAFTLANPNFVQLWKGLDASLMLHLSNILVELSCERIHGWKSLFIPLLALPFETVLTRLSTDPLMKNKNFFSALWFIFDHEGIFGLMKGSWVRVLDLLSTNLIIKNIRPSIESALGQSSSTLVEPSCQAASSILLYPSRILIRRLQAQTALDEKKSSLEMLSHILQNEGPSSLYSGYPLYILSIFIHHYNQLFFQTTLQ